MNSIVEQVSFFQRDRTLACLTLSFRLKRPFCENSARNFHFIEKLAHGTPNKPPERFRKDIAISQQQRFFLFASFLRKHRGAQWKE